MIRNIFYKNTPFSYELKIKNVKNINMRVYPDGGIAVSANKFVSFETIDAFVISKGEFILNAKKKYESLPKPVGKVYYEDNELFEKVISLCNKEYPYFEKMGIPFPKIKFRNMKSRWGSCNISKHIITFSTQLKFLPERCIRYVILHEFTHFLQANHSKNFYIELEKVCPDYIEIKKEMKNITVN